MNSPIFFRMVLLSLLMISCTKGCQIRHESLSPEDVLEAYLNLVFNMNDIKQKEDLLTYTTGNLRVSIASASDESIKEAYLKKRYNLKSFSVLQKLEYTPREVAITYRLDYEEIAEENEQNKVFVTTTNTVDLLKEHGSWYLREVVGSKSEFDFPTTKVSAK